MASNDPEFEAKAADVIGLYLNPPQHAAVFCVDEKTAIQALDRLDPVLPLSPGRAERHGFEYYRHGTLSLYAALNVKTGAVQGKTAKRHTSAEFVRGLLQCPSQHLGLDSRRGRARLCPSVARLQAFKTRHFKTLFPSGNGRPRCLQLCFNLAVTLARSQCKNKPSTENIARRKAP